MPWGRIDDGFDDHRKVLALLEHDRGVEAVGLWTLCFTWANRNTRKEGQTPGKIPAGLPRRFIGPGAHEVVALLVKVGLWEESEDGWLFHDFAQGLPTAETREARRAAGKRGAEARWGKPAPDEPPPSGGQDPDGNLPDSGSTLPRGDSNLPSGSQGVATEAHGKKWPGDPSPNPIPNPKSVVDVVSHVADRYAPAIDDDLLLKTIIDAISERTGRVLTAEQAGAVATDIIGGAKQPIGSLRAYVKRAIRNEPDPKGRWLTADREPPASACGNCGPYRRLEDAEGNDLGACPVCVPGERSAAS